MQKKRLFVDMDGVLAGYRPFESMEQYLQKGYYISLGDHKTGIDAFCTTVLGNQIPQIGDKVACQIIKINVEDCFAVAKINRIIQVARR